MREFLHWMAIARFFVALFIRRESVDIESEFGGFNSLVLFGVLFFEAALRVA